MCRYRFAVRDQAHFLVIVERPGEGVDRRSCTRSIDHISMMHRRLGIDMEEGDELSIRKKASFSERIIDCAKRFGD